MSNQTLIRQVNDVVAASFAPGEWMEVLCECGNAGCTRLVPLTREQYDAVCADAGRFIVEPGHEADSEAIVECHRGFAVVANPAAQPA